MLNELLWKNIERFQTSPCAFLNGFSLETIYICSFCRLNRRMWHAYATYSVDARSVCVLCWHSQLFDNSNERPTSQIVGRILIKGIIEREWQRKEWRTPSLTSIVPFHWHGSCAIWHALMPKRNCVKITGLHIDNRPSKRIKTMPPKSHQIYFQ